MPSPASWAPLPSPVRNLLPGELYCTSFSEWVGTVLGSCVAVCLWDQRLHFGGMNHFMLPNRLADDDYSFRFGDVAVPELIDRMLRLGSDLRNLQAKLFGGACVLGSCDSGYAVGQRNITLAVNELRRYRIPVVSSRLSGTQGLLIRQCTGCGEVWVRPTGMRNKRPAPLDRAFELRSLSENIAAVMVIRNEGGRPVAIRTRNRQIGARECQSCFGVPYWR